MTLHAEDTLLPVLCWAFVFNVVVAVVPPSWRWDGEVYGMVAGAFVVGAIAIIRGRS